MGRTTSEKKDRKIDLRISQELYDELAREGQVSSVIRSRLTNAAQNKIAPKNSVAQNAFSTEKGKDLVKMLECFGKTESEFVADVHDLMESGKLTYENGKLTIDIGFDYGGFLAWCKGKNANPRIVFQNIGREIGF